MVKCFETWVFCSQAVLAYSPSPSDHLLNVYFSNKQLNNRTQAKEAGWKVRRASELALKF